MIFIGVVNIQKCLSKYEDLMTRYSELQHQIEIVNELNELYIIYLQKEQSNVDIVKSSIFICETLLILYMFLENLENTYNTNKAKLEMYKLFVLQINLMDDPILTDKDKEDDKDYYDAYKDKTNKLVEKINKIIKDWVGKLDAFAKLITENQINKEGKSTCNECIKHLLNYLDFLKKQETQLSQAGGYKNKPSYKLIKNNKRNNRVAKAKKPDAKDAIVPTLKKAKKPDAKDAENLKTKRIIRFNLF